MIERLYRRLRLARMADARVDGAIIVLKTVVAVLLLLAIINALRGIL